MATAFQSTTHPPTLPYQPMRISVERYHQMIADGFFAENERFELLKGVIVEKMTKHPPHAFATKKCYSILTKMLAVAWHVISEQPITLTDSAPEPDVAIIRGSVDEFTNRHPEPSEILVVMEVADSSVVTDRYKAEIYAEAGIPIYWLINLQDRVVEVYSTPRTVGKTLRYTEQRLYRPDEQIPVQLETEIVGHIAVHELIPVAN